mgnify:FL=1|tara:strand:+ start:2380 stop:2769 length:390 start_codon:yes stop_codon:yes gene_type:complete
MSLIELIDDLPSDILLECAKYIYLQPIKLLEEINHYGDVKYSIQLLKSYRINDLILIHRELLKSWYDIHAKSFLNEMNYEHDAVCDIVFSYYNNDCNIIINNFIKKLIMILPANISNLTIQKEKYIYNE